MKKTAIIVAGGNGSRMNQSTPKQFISLEGKPVLVHTIEAFLQADQSMEIVVVFPADHLEYGKELLDQFLPSQNIQFATGGKTRFHSVKSGLSMATSSSIVLVHDAVRCLVTPTLIQRCIKQAVELGSAIPAIASKDSIRLVTEQDQNVQLDRSRIRLVQTPQTFSFELLWRAYQVEHQDSFTDEANVLEAAGHQVHLIEGEEDNIKITFPTDLILAAQILKSRKDLA
jgi:2-C-methyl-D-erythritol 4-phosphate cytidylyltransferase